MADFGTIQFQEAEALRKRVAELEAALRPFADGYRYAKHVGRSDILTNSWASDGRVTLQNFHRAAELMPPNPE